jgi:hypothetical protein
VAWVPPASIAVSTSVGLYMLNVDNDSFRWQNSEQSALDLFTMQDGAGNTILALVTPSGVGDAYELHTFDLQGTPLNQLQFFSCNAGAPNCLALGFNCWSVTVSPLDPTHILATGCGTSQSAWDVDTVHLTPKTIYRPDNGKALETIYSLAGSKRTAWSTKDQTPSAVYYTTEPGTKNTPPSGPVRCTPGCDSILHVVPDPTASDRFIALCDAAKQGDPRKIVRFSTAGGTCTKIVDDDGLGVLLRAVRLAIAP